MKKRSVNERIEDGILMLSTTIDFIVKNNLEKVNYVLDYKDETAKYISEHILNYVCTRKQYLELDDILLDTGKFYRERREGKYNSSDNDMIIRLNIKEDRPASEYQRISLRHDLGYKDYPGILTIIIDGGIGFERNKIYGNQIMNLKAELP